MHSNVINIYQRLPVINAYQGNRITSTAEDTRIVFSAFHHAVTAVQCAILTHPIMLLNGCLTPPLTTYLLFEFKESGIVWSVQ